MRLRFLSTLLSTTLIALVGCSQPEQQGTTMKIGAILPLTGSGAEDGEFQKHGIDLAVAKLNAGDGINGRKVEIVFEDSKNQAKDGISALTAILDRHKVPVVISTMSGVSSQLAAYAGDKLPVVLLVTVASTPRLTRHGENIFRAFITSDVESKVIAEFLHKRGFRSAALLYVNDDYGIGGQAEFHKRFEQLGGKVAFEESYEKGSTDHRNLVAKTLATDCDTVFVVGYDKSFALLIQQLKQGSRAVQLAATSTLSVPAWKDLAGPAAEGAFLAASTFKANPNDPATLEFDLAYRNAFGRPSNYLSAASYTTVMMVAEAIRQGGYSKEGIEEGLRAIKDMPSLVGEITVAGDREASFPVRMAQIANGVVVSIE